MKKYLWPAVLLFAGGCLVLTEDPAADKAAALYSLAVKPELRQVITLEKALTLVKTGDRVKIRRLFALYSWAKENNNLLMTEKGRVELNTFLGFLPEAVIGYETIKYEGSPSELPPVESAEKTALILDGGSTPVLEVVRKVRIAHANAVLWMNQIEKENSTRNRFYYMLKCLDLAAVIGVDLPELHDLSCYEKRFDDALERGRKYRKNIK